MKTFRILSVFFASLVLVSCGGGNGGGGGGDEYGKLLNADWLIEDLNCEGTVTGGTFAASDGLAVVTVAAGEMSPCTNSTGPGSYTILGNDPTTGPAAVLYSPGTIAAVAGTGHVYESTGGTLNLTSWGTANLSHITGTFNVTMQSDETPPTTGSMSGTFDFIVGSGNEL